MAPNVFPLYYRALLMYIEPLIFSMGGVLPLIKDPQAFQASLSPGKAAEAVAAKIPLLLANVVALNQYGALLIVVGLSSYLIMRAAVNLPDPSGRSQESVIRAIQIALLVGDLCFAFSTIVPYVKAGHADLLNPLKLLAGQAEFVMIPFLNVYLSFALSATRLMWFLGLGRESPTVEKKKSL